MATKAQVRRSKLGCWECKSRHVRCDGTYDRPRTFAGPSIDIHPTGSRPSCGNCASRAKQCIYGIRLIWQEDSLSRGVSHGRARNNKCPYPKQVTRCRPIIRDITVFLNTSTFDLECYYNLFRELPGQARIQNTIRQDKRNDDRFMGSIGQSRNDTFGDYSLTLHWPSLSLNPVATTSFDFALLSYYETVVCSSSTLLDDEHSNPYRHLLLPMAMQINSVYHAIMAVTAQILSISDPRWEVAALEHGIHATQALYLTIQQPKHSSTAIKEMQVLTLLLCWLEITNNSSASWLTHLYGMQSMLITDGPMKKQSHTDNFYRFLTRYFVFHWVLARTIFAVDHGSVPMPANVSSQDADQSQNDVGAHCSAWTECLSLYLSPDEMNHIDSYMGMSNTLLLLINEIAEIYRETPALVCSEQYGTVRGRIQRIRRSLVNLQQFSPVNTGQSREAFDAIAETNRLGAILYLHVVGCLKLNRAESWSYEDDDGFHDVESLLKTIIEYISINFDLVSKCAAMPLWPLFVTGCFCTEDNDRVQVASFFDRLEAQCRFGNIAPARKVVQWVWKQYDLNVQDDRKRRKTMAALHGANPGQSSRKVKGLVWESAMRMLGDWKLSLT